MEAELASRSARPEKPCGGRAAPRTRTAPVPLEFGPITTRARRGPGDPRAASTRTSAPRRESRPAELRVASTTAASETPRSVTLRDLASRAHRRRSRRSGGAPRQAELCDISLSKRIPSSSSPSWPVLRASPCRGDPLELGDAHQPAASSRAMGLSDRIGAVQHFVAMQHERASQLGQRSVAPHARHGRRCDAAPVEEPDRLAALRGRVPRGERGAEADSRLRAGGARARAGATASARRGRAGRGAPISPPRRPLP